ncbi:hypothetical protein [Mycobacterium paraterrae]|uniref:PE domain-containing protein n=1 Tax=Mycobacterium paraterrae TaxID=577492 RepID=A0ABY3VHS6_9MYCO|nr:hypothetical protein [Mycobacterium paraterrae]UMB67714.1 hypothetical protein MKK62_14515 [Mycobacterium paraterrae]
MTYRHPRAILGAAVGALGAFAAVATNSPVAHADSITDGVAAIEAAANTAYSTALTDLGNPATEAAGLTQLFIAVDDDLFGIPSFYETALTDQLQGVAIIPPTDFEIGSGLPFDFSAPTSLAQSVTEANTIYVEGATTLVNLINSLPATDLADATLYNAQSLIDQFILPGQIELIANLVFAL